MAPRPLGGPTGITRRKLIAGFTAVGAAGALTGVGAAAFLRDREGFPDNLLRAGALDLQVVGGDGDDSSTNVLTVDFGDVDGDDTRTERFFVQLADDPANNPGCPWFRFDCPVVSPEDRADVLAAIEATLVYDPSGRHVEVFSGSLLALATTDGPNEPLPTYYRALREGVPLGDVVCADTDACEDLCLDPGDRLPFELTWTVDAGVVRSDDEDVDVVASYVFGAVQERHSSGAGYSPFGPQERPACEYEVARNYAISYVAFCSRDEAFRDLTPDDFAFENLAFDDGPSLVEWTLLAPDVDLDAVVIKYGAGHFEWDKEIFRLEHGQDSGLLAVLAGDQHWADDRVEMDLDDGRGDDSVRVNRFPCPSFYADYRDDGKVDETYYLVKFEWDDDWRSTDGVLVGDDDGIAGGSK